MQYHFHKGFTDGRLWRAFQSAVGQGDYQEIAAIVHQAGMERLPVDAYAHAMPVNHRRAETIKMLDWPAFDTSEFQAETDLVMAISELRDEKLVDLPKTYPKGMRVLHPVLAEYDVAKYTEGKDYGTDPGIAQAKTMPPPDSAGTTKIETARDASAFVHTDNPLVPWMDAVKALIAAGAPYKTKDAMETLFPGQAAYGAYGEGFFVSLLGGALKEVLWAVFRAKWTVMRMRPEEATQYFYGEELKMAYPEGSPMSPSMPAGHSVIAKTMAALLLQFFDGDHVMEDGETVHDYLHLLADNIGYFRVLAGVHYPSDHTAYTPMANALAEQIARQYLR